MASYGGVLLGIAVTASGTLGAPGVVAHATPTVVRVGGPSDMAESKIAVVASDRNLKGARFVVTQGTRTVLRGRLRSAHGSPAPWAHAYRADLSALQKPGSYRVRAGGTVSRPWLVQAGGSRSLVPLLLRFFAGNRDGNEPSPLHGPSHLNDAVVAGGTHDGERIDMTGGWMDAGDMIHFSQTTGFSTALLEAAARLDPENRESIRDEAEVGVRWLLKAHPFPDLFVTQVAGEVDHFGFRDPGTDDGSSMPGIGTRQAFHSDTGVGGDIGGKVAAALALAADGASEPRRSELVAAAADWYAAGKAAGAATPEVPGTGGFYRVDTFEDSLAAGAAALFRVTGEASYLDDAMRYLRATDAAPLDYGNFAPLAAADICGRLGAPPLGEPAATDDACRFLDEVAGQADEAARANAFAPAGGFDWGSTAISSAAGAFASMAGGSSRALGAGARDYLLGRNPWGASFVTGFGPRSPKHVHHWASVLGSNNPPGAVVGGPAPLRTVRVEKLRPGGPLRKFNSRIVYEDARADYVTSEPTIDANATAVLLLSSL
jgi:endoglucanase